MGFGMTELIVILVIVLLLFGTKKLKTLGGDLGTAIKGFKNAMAPEEPAKLEADAPGSATPGSATPEQAGNATLQANAEESADAVKTESKS